MITAPYAMDIEEKVAARLAWSAALNYKPSRAVDLIRAQLCDLPPDAVEEIAELAAFFAATVKGLVMGRVVSALLDPDALPEGVVGQHIGGRS